MLIKTDLVKSNEELTFNTNRLLGITCDDYGKILKTNSISTEDCQRLIDNVCQWYDCQPHLPKGQLTLEANIFRQFLGINFSPERAKKKIDDYYTARNKMPEILKCRDPMADDIDEYLHEGYCLVIPKKTPHNTRITILRLPAGKSINLQLCMKVAFMIADYRYHNDVCDGDEWILDFTNATLNEALQMTPVFIAKLTTYLTCLSVRIKGLHLISMPKYGEAAFNVFKGYMSNKIVERVRFHSSFGQVLKLFPRSIFPGDLGGDDISTREITDNWRQTLQSPQWRQWFILQSNAASDETRRVNPLKSNEFYGVEGSFRKLNID